MLLGRLEEQDEVLQCQFSDNSDDEESEGQEKSEIRYVNIYINIDWFNKHDTVNIYRNRGFFTLKKF